MRLVGFRQGTTAVVARAVEADLVQPIAPVDEFWADPYRWCREGLTADPVRIAAADRVPPILGSARVICIGLNYAAHAEEGRWEAPQHPTVFGRWTSSLTTSGAPVAVPPDEAGLDWEGELVAVLGRPLSKAAAGDALDAVFGYAAFNDLTARTAQKLTTQWTLGKNVDRSGPLGEIVTTDELRKAPDDLRIQTRVNGEVMQSASTADMIFPVGELLSLLSRFMTLHPGDLLATGTPSGVGYVRTPPRFLQPGDVVEVEIEEIGNITTPVVASS